MRRLSGREHAGRDGSSDEVRKPKVKIAYICNGMAHCSDKPGCFRCGLPGMMYCKHTWDPKYAANGGIKNPEKCPERFHLLENSGFDGFDVYWEGGFDLPT